MMTQPKHLLTSTVSSFPAPGDKPMKNICHSNVRRRTFLRYGTLILTAGTQVMAATPEESAVSFALLTDLHFADKPPAGTRHYRETLDKVADAAASITSARPDFLVELGDLIDSADSIEKERGHLVRINERLATLAKTRHYVLGNHCVHTLTKPEFLECVEQQRSWYSFQRGGVHFVVLDACFRSDGTPYGRGNFQWTDPNISQEQLDWLQQDLADQPLPTIVFVHQRLDVANQYGIRNAPEVRAILEKSGNVICVFQGHSHHNALNWIADIPYCTVAAMVEGSGTDNSAFAIVHVTKDGTITVEGFVKQQDYHWPA
jgi:predicted phosphodiesterase